MPSLLPGLMGLPGLVGSARVGGSLPGWAVGTDLWRDFSSNYGSLADPTDTHAATIYMPNASGVWTSKAANVLCRENGVGLQTVPTRTNSIRNNSMVGAVVGAPGTLPTNWTISYVSGISSEVVGTGTDNTTGLPYIDIKISGTAGAGGTTSISFDSSRPAAAVGNIWTMSAFVALMAGAWSAAGQTLTVVERGAAAAFEAGTSTSLASVTSTPTRVQATRTFSDVDVQTAGGNIFITMTNGVAYDMTIRIIAPQLEGTAASFASPPILTTSAAATVNGNQPLFDLTGRLGTGVAGIAQVVINQALVAAKKSILFSDGTGNNRVGLGIEAANLSGVLVYGGVAEQLGSFAGFAQGAVLTIAFAFAPNFKQMRCVGQTGSTTVTTANWPAGMSQVAIGGAGYSASENTYQLTKKLALKFGPQDQASFDAMYARAVLAAAA